MTFCRYWIVNMSTRVAVPAYGRRREVNDAAVQLTRKTGNTHLVTRCVAFTDVVVKENVK